MVNFDNWVDFSSDQNLRLNAEQIERVISTLREIYSQGEVSLEIAEIAFPFRTAPAGFREGHPTESEKR